MDLGGGMGKSWGSDCDTLYEIFKEIRIFLNEDSGRNRFEVRGRFVASFPFMLCLGYSLIFKHISNSIHTETGNLDFRGKIC